MPRGRPNPPSQIADGGGIHLGPDPEILEQDRPELDQPKGRLAPGDDGVHAGTVAVVGADAAVAIAVEGGGVAAVPAIAFAGDEIDEGRFLGLLQRIPLLTRVGTTGSGARRAPLGLAGLRGFREYRWPNPLRQEGNPWFERDFGSNHERIAGGQGFPLIAASSTSAPPPKK